MSFDHQNNYVCECGKEFTNSQSFNGHKSHCKEHLIKTGKFEHYLQRQATSQSEAAKARSQKCKLKSAELLNQWIQEKHVCETCGVVMVEKYGSGRFCSRSCANSHKHDSGWKENISIAVRQYHLNLSKSEDYVPPQNARAKECVICGKSFFPQILESGKFSKSKTCSDERHLQLRIKRGKETAEYCIANGKHKSWQSRKIKSYAESFFEDVLDSNNISYIREFPVKHNNSSYFLDFAIETKSGIIDLEIDGKQHKYDDRMISDKKRDNYLSDIGYIIYRIPWNDLRSDSGKQHMENKINDFLRFYNSLV